MVLYILTNQNLLLRFEDKLYEWKIASPLLLALLCDKKPLPSDTMQLLITGKKLKRENIIPRSKSPDIRNNSYKIEKSAVQSNPGSPRLEKNSLQTPLEDFCLDSEDSKEFIVKNNHEFFRTKVPTSELLKELSLIDGMNDIEFVLGIFKDS